MDSKLKSELQDLKKLGIGVGNDLANLLEKVSSIKNSLTPEQREEVEKAEKEAGVMDEALEQLKKTNLDFDKWA